MPKSIPSNDRPLISFDWAVQRMLRQKSDFSIPEGFFSVMLDMDISIEEILDPQTNKDFARQKISVVGIHQGDAIALSPDLMLWYGCTYPGELYPEIVLIHVAWFDDRIRSPKDEWMYYLKQEKLREKVTVKGLHSVNERL
ncbi:hypothetical protein [Schleiferia thermophila]|jgi:hypothetical protein|uniref:Uncharacterized protein n=1 Tax=Schleiferia thermophila TaxID=884107 RepID=A0A369A1W8_9FLAO